MAAQVVLTGPAPFRRVRWLRRSEPGRVCRTDAGGGVGDARTPASPRTGAGPWSPAAARGQAWGGRTPGCPRCPDIPAAAGLPPCPGGRPPFFFSLRSRRHIATAEKHSIIYFCKKQAVLRSLLVGGVTAAANTGPAAALFAPIHGVPGEHKSWSQCPSRTDSTLLPCWRAGEGGGLHLQCIQEPQSVLSVGTAGKGLALTPLHPPFGYLPAWVRSL